jgi:hypothetical protein
MQNLSILKDKEIDEKTKENLIYIVIEEIQYWMLKIISFSSEFMIVSLMKDDGFDVGFIESNKQSKKMVYWLTPIQ